MKPVTKELENKEKGVHNLYKNQGEIVFYWDTKSRVPCGRNLLLSLITFMANIILSTCKTLESFYISFKQKRETHA